MSEFVGSYEVNVNEGQGEQKSGSSFSKPLDDLNAFETFCLGEPIFPFISYVFHPIIHHQLLYSNIRFTNEMDASYKDFVLIGKHFYTDLTTCLN